MTDYVISGRPLTPAFARTVEAGLPRQPRYTLLHDLESLTKPRLFRHLATLPAKRVLLAFENDNALATRQILRCLALATPASEIRAVYPDGDSRPIGRGAALAHALDFAYGCYAAWRATRSARRELDELMRRPRPDLGELCEGPVLYLNANLWFGLVAGGSIGHVAGIVNALNRSGRKVVYASPGEAHLLDPDVRVVRMLPPPRYSAFPEHTFFEYSRSALAQVVKVARGMRPSFIYQRMSIANYTGAAATQLLGIPLVLEYNSSEVWTRENWKGKMRCRDLALAAEDASLRHAQVVVTVSDALRDELMARGVPDERIVNYPNCIDPDAFDPKNHPLEKRASLRARYGIPLDGRVVGFIGTFGRWHGIEVFAKAIAALVASDSPWLEARRVRFLLVGDGPLMPLAKSILADCERFVVWTGLVPQREAAAHLAITDILVSPHVRNEDGSRFFGSPTKLFEYMAMAKGIIASDLDQIGQILGRSLSVDGLPMARPDADEDRLALLVPPGDVVRLAAAIRFLVDQADWCSVLGENARREALTRYCWSHHLAQIDERLTQLAHRR